MTALWIILAIALVLTVLDLLPVGVDAAYANDVFSLAARIGPFRLRLLPKPPDAKPKKKKPPKLLANIEFMAVPTKIAPNIILDTLMANVTI